MGHPSRTRWMLALTVGAWLLVVPAANAYVDPGSTTFLFQALVAGAMAAGMTLKVFWRRFVGLFKGGSTDDAPDDDQRQASPVSTTDRE